MTCENVYGSILDKPYYSQSYATSNVLKAKLDQNYAFWGITQRIVVISYRQIFSKRRQEITTTRCVNTQKSTVLVYVAAEA